MRARRQLTVLKLGGSYAFSAELTGWLQAIAQAAGSVVLVPGGGPFADAVRAAQPRMGFDDAAAHHMALLGMEQYGRALVALNADFVQADSIAAIRRSLNVGKVPVWSPTRMVPLRTEITASWDVTSDGLAAWLACRMGAQRLLLVKHVDPPPDPVRLADLVDRGVVDRSVARFLNGSATEVTMAGPSLRATVATALRQGGVVGSRIALR